MNQFAVVTLLLTVLTSAVTSSQCTVCNRCINCSQDIYQDGYINDIDKLLQSKIEQLGYLIMIKRAPSPQQILYELTYSGGLYIKLALQLPSLQIQLISYQITGSPNNNSNVQSKTQSTTISSSSQSTSTTQTNTASQNNYQMTHDGYYIITNLQNDVRVQQSMAFLRSKLDKYLTNFKLERFEMSKDGVFFRLSFKVLPISTQMISVYQTVLLQKLESGYQLLNSSYSQIPARRLEQTDPKLLANDPWTLKINSLLLRQYGKQLGNTSILVALGKAQPYYKFVYQVGSINYSFSVLFDYFQNRIIEGNLTTYQLTTSTQSQTTTQTNVNQATAQGCLGSCNQSNTNQSFNSCPFTSTTQNNSTTTNNSQQSTQTSSKSQTQTSSSQVSSSQKSSQPSLKTTQITSTVVTQQQVSTVFQDVKNINNDEQAKVAINLVTSFTSFSKIRGIVRVQRKFNGTHTIYAIISQLDTIGKVNLGDKTVFFQFLLSFDMKTRRFIMEKVSYTSLPTPTFTLLTIDEIKTDDNIVHIAKYLLEQRYPKLSPTSRVITVHRDIPYYQLTFLAANNIQMSFLILLNIDGIVNVMDIKEQTTSQTPTINTQQTTHQTTEKNQTNIQTGTQTQQSTSNAQEKNQQTQTSVNLNIVEYAGTKYQRLSQSISAQSYIKQYLSFLARSGLGYSEVNLMGIFTDPEQANSLLFQFKNGDKIAFVRTNTIEIQRILKAYLTENSQNNAQNNQQTSTKTTVNPESSNTQTVKQTIKAQTTQTTNSQTTSSHSSFSSNSASSASSSTSSSSELAAPSVSKPTQQTSTVTTINHHNVINADKNCLCYNKETCLRCAHRYYLNNNRCILIPNQCLTFDIDSGQCLGCVPGYQLQSNGKCSLQIASAYYFDNQCVSCYANERLINNKCVVVPQNDPSLPSYKHYKNPLCLSWKGNRCLECYPGTYLSKRNLCEMLDPFCEIFEYVSETCTKCNSDYIMRNGKCYPK